MIYLFIILLLFLWFYIYKKQDFLFFIEESILNKANEIQKDNLNKDIKIFINCIIWLILILVIAELSLILSLILFLVLLLYIIKYGINAYNDFKNTLDNLKLSVEFAKKQEEYKEKVKEEETTISKEEINKNITQAIKHGKWKENKETIEKQNTNIDPIKRKN